MKHRGFFNTKVKLAKDRTVKSLFNLIEEGDHIFHKGIILTVKVITRLKFERTTMSLSRILATTPRGGCPRGVMVKVMDCGIVVSEFVLQSRYYVHFRANTLGKGMNPIILPATG